MKQKAAFTLIELSIVLVIIGLIVGGVLVGRDLINAATVRAQVTQIEKYNTAVNTFYGKYAGLPGDLAAASAAKYNFVARSGGPGRGEGNGELDGVNGPAVSWNINGEDTLFWEDLSSAGLIDGSYTTYVDNSALNCSVTTCPLYFPSAKMGNGNMVYTYSGYAPVICCSLPYTGLGPNFFGVQIITSIAQENPSLGGSSSKPGMTPAQAYAIDKKVDDGVPNTGNVMAQYVSPYMGTQDWTNNASSDSASTCFNTANATAAYSLTYNNGSGLNCALSFKMQGGD